MSTFVFRLIMRVHRLDVEAPVGQRRLLKNSRRPSAETASERVLPASLTRATPRRARRGGARRQSWSARTRAGASAALPRTARTSAGRPRTASMNARSTSVLACERARRSGRRSAYETTSVSSLARRPAARRRPRAPCDGSPPAASSRDGPDLSFIASARCRYRGSSLTSDNQLCDVRDLSPQVSRFNDKKPPRARRGSAHLSPARPASPRSYGSGRTRRISTQLASGDAFDRLAAKLAATVERAQASGDVPAAATPASAPTAC